jgi:hypothetical protein
MAVSSELRPILKPADCWPKFRSDEDWICQLLIKYVNNESLESQEEIDYALCWRQGPITTFPLKLGIVIRIIKEKVRVSLNFMTVQAKNQTLPEICTKDGNQERLKIPLIHVDLKTPGKTVRRKQYPIPFEGRIC